MEKPIGKQQGQKPVFNAEEELAAADYPAIRIFKVEKMLVGRAAAGFEHEFSGWLACSSNTLLDSISFFRRRIISLAARSTRT